MKNHLPLSANLAHTLFHLKHAGSVRLISQSWRTGTSGLALEHFACTPLAGALVRQGQYHFTLLLHSAHWRTGTSGPAHMTLLLLVSISCLAQTHPYLRAVQVYSLDPRPSPLEHTCLQRYHLQDQLANSTKALLLSCIGNPNCSYMWNLHDLSSAAVATV